jgi:hypothetical protein
VFTEAAALADETNTAISISAAIVTAANLLIIFLR